MQTASGNFNAGSAATVSETSTDSSSMSQLGSDNPADVYSFSSVVYQSKAASTGSQSGLSSSNWAGTVVSSLVSSSLSHGILGTGNDSVTRSFSAGSVALQTGAVNTSSTEVVTSRNSLLEKGSHGPAGSGYSSVVLGSASSDSSTVRQINTTQQNGSNWANNATSTTIAGTLALTTGTTEGWTWTSLQESTGSTSNSFRTGSSSTSTSSALSSSSLSQRGSYGNGSYAFSSQVYQAQTLSQVSYQERDTANFTGLFQSQSSTGTSNQQAYLWARAPAG